MLIDDIMSSLSATEMIQAAGLMPTIWEASHGKQNIKDSGLINVSDAEVSRRAKDKSLSPKERQRYKKEDKARKLRPSRQTK